MDALLLTLTSRPAEVPPGQPAAALVEAGLAQCKIGQGGIQRYALTKAGTARKQEVQAARKAEEQARKQAEKEAARAAKQAAKPSRRTTAPALDEARLLAGVRALLAEHREALLRELMEWHRTSPSPAAPAVQPAAQQPAPPDAAAQMLHALQRLDAQHRYDGLVPLRALRPAVPGVPRAAFDATLLDLEARRQLDLKIANDPVAVPEPEAGIRVDGRGLIYYVVRR